MTEDMDSCYTTKINKFRELEKQICDATKLNKFRKVIQKYKVLCYKDICF
jgi:hypothetical protein